MKRTTIVAAVLAIVTSAATAGEADLSGQFAAPVTSSKSRSEVRAELKEAQRTGDILASGEQGLSLYEQNPRAYPAQTVVAGKTRSEVRAETLQAIREGGAYVGGEVGSVTGREQFPQVNVARSSSARWRLLAKARGTQVQ